MTATPKPPAIETPWMTVREVQAYSRQGRREVLDALGDGSLRGHQRKPGGKWTVHRDDVDAWLRGDQPEPIRSRIGRSA